MISPWINPKIYKPEIARFYWVYCHPGKRCKARVIIDDKWFDSNYSVVENVILYTHDIPPDAPTIEEINSLLGKI